MGVHSDGLTTPSTSSPPAHVRVHSGISKACPSASPKSSSTLRREVPIPTPSRKRTRLNVYPSPIGKLEVVFCWNCGGLGLMSFYLKLGFIYIRSIFQFSLI